jgi:hypothetical protein
LWKRKRMYFGDRGTRREEKYSCDSLREH